MRTFRTGRYATATAGLGLVVTLCVAGYGQDGHEGHGAHDGHDHDVIVDPLRVHHAFIENEFRVNTFYLRGPRVEDEKRTDGWRSTLEVAWETRDGRWGAEVFLPVSNMGEDRTEGLEDIEVQPVKHAFIEGSDLTVTGALGVGLAQGSRTKGLGEGHRTVAPHLFVDWAWDPWGAGLNLAPEMHVSGESGAELEYGLVGSRVFGSPGEEGRRWAPAVSAEILGTRGLGGEERRTDRLSILPGLHLRHASGWHVRLGVELPLTSDREQEAAFVFQVGTHPDWGSRPGR